MTLTRRRLLSSACALAAAAACGPATPAGGRPDSPLAANVALGVWPEFVARAPQNTRTAYEYAAGPQRSLQYIPCYCGCGQSVGHEDNLGCYVQRFMSDGWVLADPHASGCDICVRITLDVMAMEKRGIDIAEIRRVIDVTYASAGPGTKTRKP